MNHSFRDNLFLSKFSMIVLQNRLFFKTKKIKFSYLIKEPLFHHFGTKNSRIQNCELSYQ